LEDIAASADFYVADWTSSATSFDLGVEPSVEPVFYAFSDVWNRLSNVPGAFDANNRPVNQEPTNGIGANGDNFAFARIRRRASGTAATVTPHFLVSEFGTGSNYQEAGTSPDVPINFAASDDALTMAAGYPWHLDETSSTHLCLAVELSAVNDPIVPPSLLGRAPGWPTTDLLVINDNNKAQRNMGVGPTAVGGCLTCFGIVHNAATFTRDIVLRYARVGDDLSVSKLDRLEVIGARGQVLRGEGELVLSQVRPGENRWVGVTLAGDAERKQSLVVFEEMVGTTVVNGFGVRATLQPLSAVARYLLRRCTSVFTRIGSLLELDEWLDIAAKARELADSKPNGKAHVAFATDVEQQTSDAVAGLIKRMEGDPFRLSAGLKKFNAALGDGTIAVIQCAHGALLERLDAALTMFAKSGGDPADIGQNARWQGELFTTKVLSSLRGAKDQAQACLDFDQQLSERRVTAADYPKLVEQLSAVLQSAARKFEDAELGEAVAALDPGAAPTLLQLLHRRVLLRLDELVHPAA
jgi:hypothetical protein